MVDLLAQFFDLMQDPVFWWLITGAVFIIFEITAIPGVGFLFSGLACLCVAYAIDRDLISRGDSIQQFGTFFILAGAWAALLWVPLRKLTQRSRGSQGFQDVVGSKALVITPGIRQGKVGHVRWSGTQLRARLDSTCHTDYLEPDTEVTITAVDGNIVTVLPVASLT